MWTFKNRFPDSIEDIETELGNEFIENLKKDGWKLKSEYPMMFDKGIDFDFYIFQKGKEKIKLEWDNWFEWKLLGEKHIIEELYSRYIKEKKKTEQKK